MPKQLSAIGFVLQGNAAASTVLAQEPESSSKKQNLTSSRAFGIPAHKRAKSAPNSRST